MPPTVQTLDQLYGSLGSIYDPQRNLYKQQMDQSQQGGQAEEFALKGTQQQAFQDIAQMASNKGMLFSGFSPDQQAKYNATKFMPALAALRGKVQDNISRLQSALVGLDSDQRKEAMTLQRGQEDRMFSWQQEQDRRKWEAEQAKVAYEREMEKLRQQQQFEGSQNAASRSAASTPATSRREEFAAAMAAAAGKDGKVSPGDYNALKQQWVASGYGDYKSFHDSFWRFANDKHWWDYR